MLVILTSMVVLPFVLPWMLRTSDGSAPTATALPGDTAGMLVVVRDNIAVSAVLFFLAAWAGRPAPAELWIRRESPARAAAFGLGWSVALRVALAGFFLVIAGAYTLQHGQAATEKAVQQFRPDIEKLLPFAALHDPVYVLILVTLVSFVLAGLREELWRAGMLAALLSLFPAGWRNRRGQILAVVLTSLIFGAAHATQGVGGMAVAFVLGVGLGAIMIGHRSLWIAVLAHGLFDATSFFLLWLLARLDLLKLLQR